MLEEIPHPPTRSIGTGFVVSAALLLLASLGQLERAASDAKSDLGKLFTSDTLFLDRLYDDRFVSGYPLDGWQLPLAPFWFPDGAIYFAVRTVTGHAAPAVIAYAVVQYVLMLLAFIFLAAAVDPARWRLGATIVLGLGAIGCQILARNGLHRADWIMAFAIQYHTGAVVVTVIALAIVLVAGRSSGVGRTVWQLVLFALLVPMVASDRIVLLWFVLPAVIGVWGWWAVGYRSPDGPRPTTVTAIGLTVVLASATVVGLKVYERYHGGLDRPMTESYVDFSSVRWKSGVKVWAREMKSRVSSGDALVLAVGLVGGLAVAHLGRTILQAVRVPHPPACDPSAVVAAVYLVGVVLSLSAPSATGSMEQAPWPWAMKYMLPTFYGAYFGLSLVVMGCDRWLRGPIVAPMVCGGLLLATTFGWLSLAVRPVSADQSVWGYYPEPVREMDELAERHGLREGLGTFWEANRTSALSRRGVRVYAIEPNDQLPCGFACYHWLGNSHWYTTRPSGAGAKPRFQFVLVGNELKSAIPKIEAVFGPPVTSADADYQRILVYNRETELLHDAAINDPTFLNTSVRLRAGREMVRYPGRSLTRESTGIDAPDGSRTVIGPTASGLLFRGPYRRLQPGRYQLHLQYSAQGSVGSNWYVFEARPHRRQEIQHSMLEFPDAVRATTTVGFTVEPDDLGTAVLDIRGWYSGQGTLTIHAVELELCK